MHQRPILIVTLGLLATLGMTAMPGCGKSEPQAAPEAEEVPAEQTDEAAEALQRLSN